jgi:hypothetical protein
VWHLRAACFGPDCKLVSSLALRNALDVIAGSALRRVIRGLAVAAAGLGAAHGQTLSLINQLEFGMFAVQTGGTVTIDASSGARLRTGDIWLMGQNAGTPARLAVTHLAGADFSVLLPPDDGVSLGKGGASMVLRSFRSSPSAGRMVGATQIISIGATLVVQPNQSPGAYAGSFQVTVSFP